MAWGCCLRIQKHLGASANKDLCGGPTNKDSGILGYILGFPYLGNCHLGP